MRVVRRVRDTWPDIGVEIGQAAVDLEAVAAEGETAQEFFGKDNVPPYLRHGRVVSEKGNGFITTVIAPVDCAAYGALYHKRIAPGACELILFHNIVANYQFTPHADLLFRKGKLEDARLYHYGYELPRKDVFSGGTDALCRPELDRFFDAYATAMRNMKQSSQ